MSDATSLPDLEKFREIKLSRKTTEAFVVMAIAVIGTVIIAPIVLVVVGLAVPTELWSGFNLALGAALASLSWVRERFAPQGDNTP